MSSTAFGVDGHGSNMLKTSLVRPVVRISHAAIRHRNSTSIAKSSCAEQSGLLQRNYLSNQNMVAIFRKYHVWNSVSGSFRSTHRIDETILSNLTSRGDTGQRQFATSSKDSGVLSNERLIQALIRKQGASSADSVQVRLVIDETPPKKPTVEVVSLSEAIQISLDRLTDLVGTQINADPPVIRATDLEKLEYQKNQKAATTKTKNQGKKSFRFKGNIADHDLERKVAGMTKNLKQGFDCDFSVSCNRYVLSKNANAGMDLVEKILSLASEDGVPKRQPQKNEDGNFIRVSLRPTKQ